MHNYYQKSIHHTHCSPSAFVRMRILRDYCQWVVEDKSSGGEVQSMFTPVLLVLVRVPSPFNVLFHASLQ